MPVDSDEETELVMAAIARHVPQPMDHHIIVPVRKKAQYIRMRELMASALRPVGQPLFSSDSGGTNGILGGMARDHRLQGMH
jgi:SAGA-associated factor 73